MAKSSKDFTQAELEVIRQKLEKEFNKGGVIFKNHRLMCEELDWEFINSTNSKKSNIKTLDCICKHHKEGQKIIIDEIFDEVKERETNYVAGTGRQEVYGHIIRKGIISLYNREGENIMAISQKELNRMFLGYTPELFSRKFKEVSDNYPKLSNDIKTKEAKWIKFMIDEKLFCDIWYTQLIRNKKFEELGFDNSIGLRVKSTDKEGNSRWQLIEDDVISKKWSEFQKSFAEEHEIKLDDDDEECNLYSMRGATDEQWSECVKEFKNSSYLSEEELINCPIGSSASIESCMEDIYGNRLFGELKAIQRVFLISKDKYSEVDNSYIKLTDDDVVELKMAVYEAIKKRYETRASKRKEKYVEAHLGKLKKKYFTMSETFCQNLMFSILDELHPKKKN